MREGIPHQARRLLRFARNDSVEQSLRLQCLPMSAINVATKQSLRWEGDRFPRAPLHPASRVAGGTCALLAMSQAVSLRGAQRRSNPRAARRLLSPRFDRDMRFARNDNVGLEIAFPTLRSGQALHSTTLRSPWQIEVGFSTDRSRLGNCDFSDTL